MKGSVLELGRQGPADRLRGRATSRNAISGARVGRLRQRRADLLGDRARLRGARGGRPLHRGRRARGRAADGRRPDSTGTPRSGRWSPRSSSTSSTSWSTTRSPRGAKRLCGGPVEVPGFSGHFIAPTVLTGVTHDMRIMREEIFGPVLPIMTVDTEQEAIDLANDSQFGLGASVWTLDRDKGERIARQIESGMVWINDHSYTHGACQCAWGGVKDSGLGRSHSKFGFYECVNIKSVSWEPSRHARHLVAPLRRGAGQGDPRLRAHPVRPRRPAQPRPARGRAAAAARDAAARCAFAAATVATCVRTASRQSPRGSSADGSDRSSSRSCSQRRRVCVALRELALPRRRLHLRRAD